MQFEGLRDFGGTSNTAETQIFFFAPTSSQERALLLIIPVRN